MSQSLDYLKELPLQDAMWWFIENVGEDAADRQELFFALRERVRTQPAVQPTAPTANASPVDALRGLMEQLEGVGIYTKGEDAGQWSGTEGLSFAEAEAALAKASTPTPEVGIRLEGGAIQSIWADQPLNVLVVDYDTEDGSVGEEDLYDLPQDDGRTSECIIHEYAADVMPEENTRIRKARIEHVDAVEDAPEGPSP